MGRGHNSCTPVHVYDKEHAAVVDIRQCTTITPNYAESCKGSSAMEIREAGL